MAENKKYSIAVIGDRDVISGFRALGLKVFAVSENQSATEQIIKIKESGEFAIILITASAKKTVPEDQFRKLTREPLPTILTIPDIKESNTGSIEHLKDLTERAIGFDILS